MSSRRRSRASGRGRRWATLLRRYWFPVAASSALDAGRAMPVRLLGEDFALFRTHDGVPGLRRRALPAPRRVARVRARSTATGSAAPTTAGASIGGACREIPSLAGAGRRSGGPRAGTRAAHRVEELGGLVFVYLGPSQRRCCRATTCSCGAACCATSAARCCRATGSRSWRTASIPMHLEWLPRPSPRRACAAAPALGADAATGGAMPEIGFDVFRARHREAARARRREPRGRRLAHRASRWSSRSWCASGAQRQHRFQIRVPVDDTAHAALLVLVLRPAPGRDGARPRPRSRLRRARSATSAASSSSTSSTAATS